MAFGQQLMFGLASYPHVRFWLWVTPGASGMVATSGGDGAVDEKGRKRKKESEGPSGESKMRVKGVYSVSQLIDT